MPSTSTAWLSSSGNPVISLYLNAQPDEHGRDNFSTFLRKELRGRVATYAADTPSRKSLERDVEKIESYIASELKPSANGVAIFACSAADDFFEALQLEAPIHEHMLIVSDRPHLYPLARVDERYPRAAALVCDTNHARIFVLAGGRIEGQREINGTVTRRHKMGGWSQARYQRHIDNYHQQHVKEVVDTLDRIVREEQIAQVVIFGDEIVVPMLRDQMPKALAEKIIDIKNLPVAAPEGEVFEKTLETLHAEDAKTDQEKVEGLLGAYRAGGLGVVGVADTRQALEIGQVEELLLSASLQQIDPSDVSGESGEPNDDDARARFADELIALARQTSARVAFIEDPSLLEPVGGVGALLRYKIPGIQPAREQSATKARS
jgi:peptide chain release factor subunit 1